LNSQFTQEGQCFAGLRVKVSWLRYISREKINRKIKRREAVC